MEKERKKGRAMGITVTIMEKCYIAHMGQM